MSCDFPLFTWLADSQSSREDPLRQRFTKAKNITHRTLECEARGFESVWGDKYSCQRVREYTRRFCEDHPLFVHYAHICSKRKSQIIIKYV